MALHHEPRDYACPFCRIIREARTRSVAAASDSEVVFQSESVTALLGLGRWPKNPVDGLIVPNDHFENIYDLPFGPVLDLHRLTRAIALTLKAIYHCEGVSIRQHNEPAGDQDVWHYHVHVTPRFIGDRFYASDKIKFPEEERLHHARRLREYLRTHRVELAVEP